MSHGSRAFPPCRFLSGTPASFIFQWILKSHHLSSFSLLSMWCELPAALSLCCALQTQQPEHLPCNLSHHEFSLRTFSQCCSSSLMHSQPSSKPESCCALKAHTDWTVDSLPQRLAALGFVSLALLSAASLFVPLPNSLI